LIFSYSGKEPDFDGDGMAEDLLEAADKYELTRLKVKNNLFKFLNIIFHFISSFFANGN